MIDSTTFPTLALAACLLSTPACAPAERQVAAPLHTTAQIVDTHDVTLVAPDHYKVLADNAHVRVVENVLRPGEVDGMHSHAAGWYYVTRPGTMKIGHPDGKTTTWEAKAGEAGWMEAEGLHSSENVGNEPMGFILVEVKSVRR